MFTLIGAKTAAEDSVMFSSKDNELPVTISAFGMLAGDVVTIQQGDDKDNWEDLWIAGQLQQLAFQTDTAKTVYGTGRWRVSKGITSGTVKVVASNATAN